MAQPDNPYRAAAAALGYAYQFRRALLRAWRELSRTADWQIAIESADDVEFHGPSGLEYQQLKHHQPGTVLQDSGDDLWKTLRVWAEALRGGRLDLNRARLTLVTTAGTAKGTVASWLGESDGRHEDLAESRLTSIASGSPGKSPARERAYAAWNALDAAARQALLAAITVVPDAPDIADTGSLLTELATLSAGRMHAASFLEMLEGWWFQRCLQLLAAGPGNYIAGEEVDAYISSMRIRFLNPDDLPVDPQIEGQRDADASFYEAKTYVRQARMANVSEARVRTAVNDYLRAFAQRSQWLRQGLLYPNDLELYENRLVEEWKLIFDRVADDLGPEAGEVEKVHAARTVYDWVEDALAPPIRTLCTERFLIRGSLHMLADTLSVGWHPDFVIRLMAILEPAGAE
ncbi:hypothetical protein CELL_01984 [Cellulomonas sp. T2.31MG-18]|uniref:ABC-three component system protein n=1 Tax=Cellulomonas sp. T2.31MG-18 TaxID=3157619 RepID=UPI0035EFC78B